MESSTTFSHEVSDRLVLEGRLIDFAPRESARCQCDGADTLGCSVSSSSKVGVKHAERRRKDPAQPIALLRVDALSSGWLLEVNVVFANNGEYSTYIYSQFALASVPPNNTTDRPSTSRPTAKPTRRPMVKPTNKPATAAPMSAVSPPMAVPLLPAAPKSPPLQPQSLPTKYTAAPVFVIVSPIWHHHHRQYDHPLWRPVAGNVLGGNVGCAGAIDRRPMEVSPRPSPPSFALSIIGTLYSLFNRLRVSL
jgi:hypothetical protein